MQTIVKIKMFSYDHRLLDECVKKIIGVATSNDCIVNGPIPLPTKKELLTICRSPHVDKRSMEQFERLTHKRILILKNPKSAIFQALKNLVIPAGVDLKIAF
jgi:small subunit ribosomal protein S10